MSFREISQISMSAMTAQSVRLNTIASNLANSDSIGSSEEEVYKAKKPVFATILDKNKFSAKVQVLDVIDSQEKVRKVYEPSNPIADEEGFIYYSNVDSVAEMTDMMSASRAFETNAEVLGRVQSMQKAVLHLGEV